MLLGKLVLFPDEEKVVQMLLNRVILVVDLQRVKINKFPQKLVLSAVKVRLFSLVFTEASGLFRDHCAAEDII